MNGEIENIKPSLLGSIRVLDFSHILAGPHCARLLTDLGAEVIKIERPPEGELSRYAGLHYWWLCNPGKKSLCIDMSKKKSVEIIHQLAKESDIVVESFRPGVMHKLGIGYEQLRAINPKIIMCSLSAYGQNNAYSQYPGTAVVAHALSGFMWLQGRVVDLNGPPQPPPFAIGDMAASLHATAAICGALYYREKTGLGQYIDISLIDSLFAMNDRIQQQLLQTDDLKSISATPIYAGKDGYVTIQGVSQDMFVRLWKAMGEGEITDDQRFDNVEHRNQHVKEMNDVIQEWVQTFASIKDLIPILEKADVVCAPILSINDASTQPRLVAREMVREIQDPQYGKLKILNNAFRFSEVKCGPKGHLPRLGEHNHEILSSLLGYSDAEITQLQNEGVIYADLKGYSLQEILEIEKQKECDP